MHELCLLNLFKIDIIKKVYKKNKLIVNFQLNDRYAIRKYRN